MAFPFPLVKLQPDLATFFASYKSSCLGSRLSFISTFSPVSEALLTLRSSHSKILKSAGTFSPPATSTMSPIVTFSVRIVLIVLFLNTEQFNGDNYLIASIVFSAFPS